MSERTARRAQVGIVVKKSGDKTFSVNIEEIKKHSQYHKYVKASKKYLAHYEGDDVNVGDHVEIVETRPISKRKSWRISRVISHSNLIQAEVVS